METKLRLELPDLPAERRLRDVEHRRGPPDIFELGHGHEVAQLTKVHLCIQGLNSDLISLGRNEHAEQ